MRKAAAAGDGTEVGVPSSMLQVSTLPGDMRQIDQALLLVDTMPKHAQIRDGTPIRGEPRRWVKGFGFRV